MSNKYLIIPITELDKVDFSQLVITSIDNLRYNNERTKAIIEWDVIDPAFLNQLNNSEGSYSADEMSIVLSNPEWQSEETLNEHQESILPDSRRIRGKYAGIGDTYDEATDTFVSPITGEQPADPITE